MAGTVRGTPTPHSIVFYKIRIFHDSDNKQFREKRSERLLTKGKQYFKGNFNKTEHYNLMECSNSQPSAMH